MLLCAHCVAEYCECDVESAVRCYLRVDSNNSDDDDDDVSSQEDSDDDARCL